MTQAEEFAKQWKAIQPSGILMPRISIRSTPAEPCVFLQEYLCFPASSETTEKATIRKPGSNRLGGDSRGASPKPASSPAFEPKRGSRGLRRAAAGLPREGGKL